jgi:serine/threonine-protein kinase HipA
MGRRSHTRRLDLWMNGERVGQWTAGPSIQELAYADNWVTSHLGRPLSLSLPFQPDNRPQRGQAVRAYFENLLPDSKRILDRMARRYQARSTNAFDLLAEIGRDCVGALQLVPEGTDSANVRRIEGIKLDNEAVARELARAVSSESPAASPETGEDLRLSIAGAQEKTALLWHDETWMRPIGATPTTHILKLPLGLVGHLRMDMTDSAENEWLCAQVVHAFGIPVAECKMERFGDFKTLVVTRFDRELSSDGTWFIRRPQEDMCQATGVLPDDKYENQGGPGIKQILDILETSDTREADRRNFFKAQILFWMLANTDGHAKNFSIFLLAGGAFRLTPLYDVLSAYPVIGNEPNLVPSPDAKLAMAVRSKNAHWRLNEIQRRHWNESARRNGIGKSAEAIIAEILDETPSVIRDVQGQLPANFPGYVAESVLGGLRDAAARLAAMPAE